MADYGILHGDISPANVVVLATDSILTHPRHLVTDKAILVKLIDLGGAANVGDMGRYGVDEYQDPAIRENGRTLSAATDIFSFCTLVFELIANRNMDCVMPFAEAKALTKANPQLAPLLLGLSPNLQDRPCWLQVVATFDAWIDLLNTLIVVSAEETSMLR
jgi:serine/threonine protein kinase